MNGKFGLEVERKALLDYFQAAEPYLLVLRQLIYARDEDVRRIAAQRLDEEQLASKVQTARIELGKLRIHVT